MFGGKRSQIRIQISDSGKKLTFPISNNFWIFCRALMLASFFFIAFGLSLFTFLLAYSIVAVFYFVAFSLSR